VLDLPPIVPGIDPPPIDLPGFLGGLGGALGGTGRTAPSDDAQTGLLDYLLGGG
jgi:hypothetical protein